MTTQERIENVIVYKHRPSGDDRGFLTPVLALNESDELNDVSKELYPSGILVSRGYSTVDSTYRDGQLFMLKSHYFDEEKTEQDGINRYWTKGDLTTPLPTSALVPIIKMPLPDVSTGAMPEGVSPPYGIFFILDETKSKLYGPLQSISSGDGQYIVEPKSTPALSFSSSDFLGVFDTREIEEIIHTIPVNGINKSYLTSLKDLANRRHSTIDYITDAKLIRYFNTMGSGKNGRLLAKKEAEKLQSSIAQFTRQHQNQNIARNSDRLKRLNSVLDQYLKHTDVGNQIVRDFFDASRGKAFLEDYVRENESRLLSAQISKLELEAKEKKSELENKIEALNRQWEKKQQDLREINDEIAQAKENAQLTIESIEQEAEDTRRQRMKEIDSELQRDIEELENKKSDKQAKLDATLQRLGLVNEINELNNRKIYLEQSEKVLTSSNKGVQEALQNAEDLAKRMGELEVVSRVLKGGSVSQNLQAAEYSPLQFASSQPTSGADIVDRVRSYLDDDFGKSFSESEMANLLISTTQSFLTVLAGPPGVGKTSSVVRLAEALRLGKPAEHKNFLYMPVARGWVSGRDILGFYNSLNNTYQRARTGLYDFLQRPRIAENNSLQLVLLDEANLSPMEHYWSDFLGMCDSEGRLRPIETGIPDAEQRGLTVQKNVRFLATINHDSTTERLSPRLIDRVPIISLEQEDNTAGDYVSGVQLDGALNYELFEQYFIPNEPELSSAHESKLNNLINLLSDRDPALGQSIAISHRKVAAITKFYSAANMGGLMDAETAFDFAVSQHILPHIEGYGTKFRARIVNLQNELGASYPRSSRHLERILACGNDFTGTYSFF